MKKNEVRIGDVYHAKVTNKRVEVRIDEVKPSGEWSATNMATHKKITIKTADGLTAIPVGNTKVTKTGNVTVVETEPASVETFENGPVDRRVPKKPKKKTKSETKTESADKTSARKSNGKPAEKPDGKTSCVAAALMVLGESVEPMNSKELIEAMEAKGYWSSPGGKTPHATLYSAILRELSKGDDSRFVKTERGRFIARG